MMPTPIAVRLAPGDPGKLRRQVDAGRLAGRLMPFNVPYAVLQGYCLAKSER